MSVSKEVKKIQEQLREKNTLAFADIITHNDIFFVADVGKYMMYRDDTGWKSYDKSDILRLFCVTDGTLFDEILFNLKRTKRSSAMSFESVNEDILNFLSVGDWLQPEQGQHDVIFDILLDSLSNGKIENREHLEQCIVWKYLHPEDFSLPCITISGEGGVGKNEFVEQVLATIFTRRQVIALDTSTAFGDYNGLMLGKAVVFIDEAIVEKSDAEALKRKVGNRTISINEKYGLQGSYENTAWYWLGGNGTNGAVMLAGDVTDRRYSVMTTSRSMMHYICGHLSLDPPQPGVVLKGDHPAVQWFKDNQAKLHNKSHVAKFLMTLIQKHAGLKRCPTALHSQDYRDVITSQAGPFEETMDHVFNRKGFTHIDGKTLYVVYQNMCKESGQSKVRGRNKFYADTKRWLFKHKGEVQCGFANIVSKRGQKSSTKTMFAIDLKGMKDPNGHEFLLDFDA